MALQQLKVWAKQAIPDSVKGNLQFKVLRDEEWLQGFGRLFGPSTQQLNSLFRLLTQYSSPSDICPYLYPDTAFIYSTMLLMDGQTITEEEAPVLFETYGSTLPDLVNEAPPGFVYIIRKQ